MDELEKTGNLILTMDRERMGRQSLQQDVQDAIAQLRADLGALPDGETCVVRRSAVETLLRFLPTP